jgi:hypothetical protein
VAGAALATVQLHDVHIRTTPPGGAGGAAATGGGVALMMCEYENRAPVPPGAHLRVTGILQPAQLNGLLLRADSVTNNTVLASFVGPQPDTTTWQTYTRGGGQMQVVWADEGVLGGVPALPTQPLCDQLAGDDVDGGCNTTSEPLHAAMRAYQLPANDGGGKPVDRALLDRLQRAGSMQVPPVCAAVGGFVATEVLKVVGGVTPWQDGPWYVDGGDDIEAAVLTSGSEDLAALRGVTVGVPALGGVAQLTTLRALSSLGLRRVAVVGSGEADERDGTAPGAAPVGLHVVKLANCSAQTNVRTAGVTWEAADAMRQIGLLLVTGGDAALFKRMQAVCEWAQPPLVAAATRGTRGAVVPVVPRVTEAFTTHGLIGEAVTTPELMWKALTLLALDAQRAALSTAADAGAVCERLDRTMAVVQELAAGRPVAAELLEGSDAMVQAGLLAKVEGTLRRVVAMHAAGPEGAWAVCLQEAVAVVREWWVVRPTRMLANFPPPPAGADLSTRECAGEAGRGGERWGG